jgi:hypothetical protein
MKKTSGTPALRTTNLPDIISQIWNEKLIDFFYDKISASTGIIGKFFGIRTHQVWFLEKVKE